MRVRVQHAAVPAYVYTCMDVLNAQCSYTLALAATAAFLFYWYLSFVAGARSVSVYLVDRYSHSANTSMRQLLKNKETERFSSAFSVSGVKWCLGLYFICCFIRTYKRDVNYILVSYRSTSSSAMTERPRDACVTSIRKIVKIVFVSYPFGDFRGNVSSLSLCRWKDPISDNLTPSL